jgi:hypothetical protein
MSKPIDQQPSGADSELEQEICQGRKFTPKEAMARMAGPGAMKGASPVSRVQQAETEVGSWLRGHITDSAGGLPVVLHRQLKGSKLLLDNLDQPLIAVAEYCRHVLASDSRLKELVREADVEWGRAMDERPYFEREGSAPNPDDPYTVESVGKALGEALKQLDATGGS